MFHRADKVSNFLFYAALVLAEIGWMFVKVKYISDFCSTFIDIAIILLVICCAIQSRKYSIKSILLISLLICIFSISAIAAGNATLLLLLLFCLASKNINLNKLINFNWKLLTFLIIIVILCYLIGATEIYYMSRADGTIRSSMGFSHPNRFGIYLLCTFCQFVYSSYRKIKTRYFIIIGASLVGIMLHFSDSRSSAYSIIILLVMLICLQITKGRSKIKNTLAKLLPAIPFVLAILSFVLVINYNSSNEAMRSINNILTTRISSAKHITDDYDIKPFGQHLDLVSTEKAKLTGKRALVLDNAYIKLLYEYGTITSIIFIAFYSLSMKKAIRDHNWLLVIMLLVFCILGLAENVMFNLYGNIFLLFFSKIIYGDTLPDGKTSNASEGKCDE